MWYLIISKSRLIINNETYHAIVDALNYFLEMEAKVCLTLPLDLWIRKILFKI